MPAAALAVVGLSASGLHAVTDFVLLGVAVAGLAVSHVALRGRSRSLAAAERERQAREALELKHKVGECERRRERLASFAELASHMAHEVRNPLSSIGLNLELLEDEFRECGCERGPAVRALLHSVQGEARRLQHLTDGYLGFARPPKPSANVEDLRELAADVERLFREEALRGGVRLELTASGQPVPVRIDRNQVKQAVINLVRNAIQATPAGGQVTIDTRVSTDGKPSLTVADTGPGVPSANQCTIFDPFFTTKPGGTGLGLPLAMHIAREHGGELRLDTPPAGGAAFTLWFPPLSAESPASTPEVLAS
jgi:signal transduction histidine kinase